MKLARCPVCHSHIHLDQLIQDDAGRELLATLVSMDAELGRWAVMYIGLWRPAKSDLSNARAARLLRETLELCADTDRLCAALQSTVAAIQKKRQQGDATGTSALDSHAYLKRVIDTTPVLPPPSPPPLQPEPQHDHQDQQPHPALKNYTPPTAVSPDARRPTAEEKAKIASLLNTVKQDMTRMTRNTP